MELWIPITIAAAILQNVRSSLQKYLKGQLSTNGATASRFLFGWPVALVILAGLVLTGQSIPHVNAEFFMFMLIGGLAQIFATSLLLYSFTLRNFAVGTAFSKTEVIQAAIYGVVVLGDQITLVSLIAIGISFVGILLLTSHQSLRGGIFNLSAGVGLLCGALFGVAAVGYRAASLALPAGDYITRAATTLAFVISFQTLVMIIWLVWREPGQVTKVLKSWRISGLVGLAGGLASFGWFAAMTLQNAAFVKALGQVEMLFTVFVSVIYFGERPSLRESAGILLTTLGIVFLLLWR